jgi:hypothetical protein
MEGAVMTKTAPSASDGKGRCPAKATPIRSFHAVTARQTFFKQNFTHTPSYIYLLLTLSLYLLILIKNEVGYHFTTHNRAALRTPPK